MSTRRLSVPVQYLSGFQIRRELLLRVDVANFGGRPYMVGSADHRLYIPKQAGTYTPYGALVTLLKRNGDRQSWTIVMQEQGKEAHEFRYEDELTALQSFDDVGKELTRSQELVVEWVSC